MATNPVDGARKTRASGEFSMDAIARAFSSTIPVERNPSPSSTLPDGFSCFIDKLRMSTDHPSNFIPTFHGASQYATNRCHTNVKKFITENDGCVPLIGFKVKLATLEEDVIGFMALVHFVVQQADGTLLNPTPEEDGTAIFFVHSSRVYADIPIENILVSEVTPSGCVVADCHKSKSYTKLMKNIEFMGAGLGMLPSSSCAEDVCIKFPYIASGTEVWLAGIKSRTVLNGQRAVVLENWVPGNYADRVAVKLSDGDSIRVRRFNIRPVVSDVPKTLETRPSKIHGNGLFTKQFICTGEAVFVDEDSNVLLVGDSVKLNGRLWKGVSGAWSLVVHILMSGRPTWFSELSSNREFGKSQLQDANDEEMFEAIVKRFPDTTRGEILEVFCTVVTNWFHNGDLSALGMKSSLVNHSNRPNAVSMMENRGDELVMVLRAIKNIKPEEEILIQYPSSYFLTFCSTSVSDASIGDNATMKERLEPSTSTAVPQDRPAVMCKIGCAAYTTCLKENIICTMHIATCIALIVTCNTTKAASLVHIADSFGARVARRNLQVDFVEQLMLQLLYRMDAWGHDLTVAIIGGGKQMVTSEEARINHIRMILFDAFVYVYAITHNKSNLGFLHEPLDPATIHRFQSYDKNQIYKAYELLMKDLFKVNFSQTDPVDVNESRFRGIQDYHELGESIVQIVDPDNVLQRAIEEDVPEVDMNYKYPAMFNTALQEWAETYTRVSSGTCTVLEHDMLNTYTTAETSKAVFLHRVDDKVCISAFDATRSTEPIQFKGGLVIQYKDNEMRRDGIFIPSSDPDNFLSKFEPGTHGVIDGTAPTILLSENKLDTDENDNCELSIDEHFRMRSSVVVRT